MSTKSPVQWPKIVAVSLITCAILCCGGVVTFTMIDSARNGDTSTPVDSFAPTLPSSSSAPPKATPSSSVVTVTDGTWVVGEDIPPGRYKVSQPITSGNCYWEISRSDSNGGDIVANDIVDGGRPTVRLKRGQDFQTGDCGTWQRTGD